MSEDEYYEKRMYYSFVRAFKAMIITSLTTAAVGQRVCYVCSHTSGLFLEYIFEYSGNRNVWLRIWHE